MNESSIQNVSSTFEGGSFVQETSMRNIEDKKKRSAQETYKRKMHEGS
jgi:hypothetical protein